MTYSTVNLWTQFLIKNSLFINIFIEIAKEDRLFKTNTVKTENIILYIIHRQYKKLEIYF